jgi:hypothetical protein
LTVCCDGRFERVGPHPQVGVYRDQAKMVSANAQQRDRFRDGHVHLDRRDVLRRKPNNS